MALIRWNPHSELFNLHSELDRVFTDVTESLWPTARPNGGQAYLPLDIRRTDSGLEITASVPGFRPDDVNVTVSDGVLTIDAKRDEESNEEDEKGYVRRERYSGRLFRQVSLGSEVDGEKARAEFKDGVLAITIPTTAKAEPKKIPVSAKQ
jgi:HSP20 family protein